ncbi:EexN family lipoprotein [Rhizobium leguminosarum]|uniref:EexN family lipoprotein n=1 Tax=Rhizobium leguminosarum TaxID=384 RepID=A0A7W9ZMY0_RHILE|nr:EexN family lipoprotein [Rhizobium leguminosarum]MBB6219647.1 hypothetical protein [Rhizobium leguminosarum]
MKRFLPVLAALFLSACSAQTEKVYTVDELAADDALLTRIIGECRNNPGELGNSPNCRNAEAADGKLRLERMRKSLGG